MKREDMPTWKLMHIIAAAYPNGVLSCDVAGMTGTEVYRIIKTPHMRGEATSVPEGRKARYFISPEQLRKFTKRERAMNVIRPYDGVRELAKRPEGATSGDSIGGRSVKRMCATLMKLHERGELFRVRAHRKGFVYFSTKELADAFEASRAKNQPQKGSAIPASFRLLNQPIAHTVTKESRMTAWRNKKTIIPDHVQIQRYPTPPGRYEVTGPIVGGFLSEWRALRAA